MQVINFLIPPTIACIITYLWQRKKISPIFRIAQWLFYTFMIYVIQAFTMIPIERSAPTIVWNGHGGTFLYIRYGSISTVVAYVSGVILGILSIHIQRFYSIKSITADRKNIKRNPLCVLAIHTIVLILLFLTYGYIWGLSIYGNITINEIIFNLNMPLEGISKPLFEDGIRRVILPTLLSFLFFEILVHAPINKSFSFQSNKHNRLWVQILPFRLPFGVALISLTCWFFVLFFCADQSFIITDYIISQMQQSELIEKEYVDPQKVSITFPEKKRNLITIYVESCETTTQDRSHGGLFDINYTPEMTELALEEISFSQSDLLQGAAVAPACGWTISGLVAQTSGLPLKMYVYDDRAGGTDNIMEISTSFMPGATSMGDILHHAGYKNVFMAGSDFSFGGRKQYYLQHGNYEILDYHVAIERGIIPENYYVNWGFEDVKLYDWAKQELLNLSSSDEPFHFAMLTVDTHMPNGYICSICPEIHNEAYGNILSCSSKQLTDFIQWCREQPFYENTTIVVTGDHPSMVKDFYEIEANKHEGTVDRLVYNAFIHSSIDTKRNKNRLFTTLDFFPTTLASIGVQIEGERLGLGTNLFSNVPTLSEVYGYETLFDDLNRASSFYNKEILYP